MQKFRVEEHAGPIQIEGWLNDLISGGAEDLTIESLIPSGEKTANGLPYFVVAVSYTEGLATPPA